MGKLISNCCTIRFWGFYYLLFKEIKRRFAIKILSMLVLLVGKKGSLKVLNDLPKLWCWPKVQRRNKAFNSCISHLRADRNPSNQKNRQSPAFCFTAPDAVTSTAEPLHGVLIICLSRGLQQFIQVSGEGLVSEL